MIERHAPRHPRYKKPSPLWQALALLIFFAFLAGGLFSGYVFYETVREWVAHTSMLSFDFPALPVVGSFSPPVQASSNTNNGASPASTTNNAPASSQSTKTILERKERTNFLLLGVDRRPGERGPTRTDTMMIVTVDPASKSVGMLSIPRDLWVTIPGYGEDRINTAYFIGEAKKYPGGGPALAKRTVQYNFGIPIHYYITINFVGFTRLIDEIGGLDIEVPKDIYDTCYPTYDYGCSVLSITKGFHHMDGEMALAYARTRHGDSDFGRMRRQQQVIVALKEQALRTNIITKAPALWQLKEDMVETDLTLDKILQLAQLAREIKSENIHNVVVDEKMALGVTTSSGAQVLWPDRDRIREVVDQLFKAPEPVAVQVPATNPKPTATTAPAPQVPEQIKKLQTENAKIEIMNGTTTDGLAGRVAEWLKAQGFNVVLVGNAPTRDYPQTVIVESHNRAYTRDQLLKIFRVSSDKVRKNPNAKSDVDYRITIGADFDQKVLPTSQQ
jgi:LCP family protein required for cell wall assembly